MDKVLQKVSKCKKPVIINFLDGDPELISESGAIPAFTLEDAALKAVALSKKHSFQKRQFTLLDDEIKSITKRESNGFSQKQKYIRGLFCGGTFCEEAILILENILGKVYSNTSVQAALHLEGSQKSREHSLLDIGDEAFIKGHPHPVIDPEPRRQRLLEEGNDPEVAVILLDFILGYGVHPDPAGVLLNSINQVKENARKKGRYLSIIAFVCGTEGDPQRLSIQEYKLRKVGVIVMPSNAQASRLAGLIATHRRK